MMKTKTRPKPTGTQIAGLCGGDPSDYADGRMSVCTKLEYLHHGLVEVPFLYVYPYLNLDELAAFVAGSWKMRFSDLEGYRERISSGTPFSQLFDDTLTRYLPFGSTRKQALGNFAKAENAAADAHTHLKSKFEKMNPFPAVTLNARLDAFSHKNSFGESSILNALTNKTKVYLHPGDPKIQEAREHNQVEVVPIFFSEVRGFRYEGENIKYARLIASRIGALGKEYYDLKDILKR
ncbi:hypothetical protein JW711_00855 [Candidatus Woesearchaeota archaeon]|nr:hypothetical protein [Candidatus Woesearchaeota archaeon]